MPYATEPGYYDGKFVKRGGHYAGDEQDVPATDAEATTGETGQDSNGGNAPQTGQTDQGGAGTVDPDSMKRDELVAEAERRGVEVKPGATKAEIADAINAAAAAAPGQE